MNPRWTGLAKFSSVFLRLALGISFLSAVADRFGIWGAYSKGTGLITGASSGIGAVYADRLAKRGYRSSDGRLDTDFERKADSANY